MKCDPQENATQPALFFPKAIPQYSNVFEEQSKQVTHWSPQGETVESLLSVQVLIEISGRDLSVADRDLNVADRDSSVAGRDSSVACSSVCLMPCLTIATVDFSKDSDSLQVCVYVCKVSHYYTTNSPVWLSGPGLKSIGKPLHSSSM